MTRSQQLQVTRFNASRSARGVSVTLHPTDDKAFVGLVEPITPEAMEYGISKETRTFSKLYLLRSEVVAAGVNPGIGSVFINDETEESYRVTAIDDNQIDVRIGYHCETSQASEE